jgi:hypothetical protein
LDLPVTPTAFQRNFRGGGAANFDALLLRLDPTASPPSNQLVYCTYLGGSSDERPSGAHPAPDGTIVVSGTTASADFPNTSGTYQRLFQGGASSNANGYVAGDAFVVRIDPAKAGSQGLVFGTFLGSPAQDQGIQSCIDSDGSLTLVGWTQANGVRPFPTTPDAMRRTYQLNDGYVCRLSADGRQLLYGSLYGGTNHDGTWRVDRRGDGVASAWTTRSSPGSRRSRPRCAGSGHRARRTAAGRPRTRSAMPSSATRSSASPAHARPPAGPACC